MTVCVWGNMKHLYITNAIHKPRHQCLADVIRRIDDAISPSCRYIFILIELCPSSLSDGKNSSKLAKICQPFLPSSCRAGCIFISIAISSPSWNFKTARSNRNSCQKRPNLRNRLPSMISQKLFVTNAPQPSDWKIYIMGTWRF